MEDEYVVKAPASHTSQKSFAGGISSWGMIGVLRILMALVLLLGRTTNPICYHYLE